MSRIGWFLAALLTAFIVALCAWFLGAIEWVEVDVPTPARGEAARDRFYVAKQLARRLGASVTTVHELEHLPPPGATLVIGSRRWSMFPGREAALRRWVEAGGHLVVLQSAWSAEGDTPRWVPMRSAPLRRDAAASSPAAAAMASIAAPAHRATRSPSRRADHEVATRCNHYAEPDEIDPPFGEPRRYFICGTPIRVLHADAPTWLLRSDEGVVAARVGYGRGDITANAIDGSLDNGVLVRDDGALAVRRRCCSCAKATPSGSSTRKRERACCRSCWEHGAPAIVLAGCGAPASPLAQRRSLRPAPRRHGAARRSVGEQVRRTAAFIAAGCGAALHRASIRALEEEARRAIAGYATLLGTRDRAEAIAGTTRDDAAALAAAMGPLQRDDRHRLAAAIARLERARRALLPDRRRSPHRPSSSDPSPS